MQYLNRRRTGFPRTNPHDLFHGGYEDLAVTNPSRLGRFFDGLDHLRHEVIRDHDLDFNFGQKINHILGPTIELRMPFLATKSLDLGDSEPLDTNLMQGFLDLI